jgi:hypothetical protein
LTARAVPSPLTPRERAALVHWMQVASAKSAAALLGITLDEFDAWLEGADLTPKQHRLIGTTFNT